MTKACKNEGAKKLRSPPFQGPLMLLKTHPLSRGHDLRIVVSRQDGMNVKIKMIK